MINFFSKQCILSCVARLDRSLVLACARVLVLAFRILFPHNVHCDESSLFTRESHNLSVATLEWEPSAGGLSVLEGMFLYMISTERTRRAPALPANLLLMIICHFAVIWRRKGRDGGNLRTRAAPVNAGPCLQLPVRKTHARLSSHLEPRET